MKISVVVPACHRPAVLERCLAALVTQEFDPRQYEIIVAGDVADAETQRMVERWAAGTCGAPAIHHVPVTHARGPAGARNRGWRAALGEVIAFTDDDTVAHPDWLREGWIAMGDGVTAASGCVIGPPPSGRAGRLCEGHRAH